MSGTSAHIHFPGRRQFAGSGVTDGSGNATIAFPAGRFAATPVATAIAGPTTNANLVDTRITSLSASSVTINVQQSLAVTLLGISILAAKTAASGITVQIIAQEAG